MITFRQMFDQVKLATQLGKTSTTVLLSDANYNLLYRQSRPQTVVERIEIWKAENRSYESIVDIKAFPMPSCNGVWEIEITWKIEKEKFAFLISCGSITDIIVSSNEDRAKTAFRLTHNTLGKQNELIVHKIYTKADLEVLLKDFEN